MAAARYPALRLSPRVYNAEERAVIRRAVRLLDRGLREPRRKAFSNPMLAATYLRSWIGQSDVEVFAGLFLDNHHRLLAAEELFRGTIAQTAVYPREVVRAAMRHNAAALIVAHNHPSGVPEPSVADRQLTRVLRDALALVDVRLLDHLIVADEGVWSFADHGLI